MFSAKSGGIESTFQTPAVQSLTDLRSLQRGYGLHESLFSNDDRNFFRMKSMRNRRTIATVGAFVAASISLAGCGGGYGGGGGNNAAAAANGVCAPDTPYKVGFVAGLTGPFAQISETQKNAINLYVDKVNGGGGINGHKIELLTEDSTGSESEAVNVTRKLLQEKVVVVIGTNSSGESIAMKQVTESSSTPLLSMASSKKIVEPAADSSHTFKLFPGSAEVLRAQMEYVSKKGLKRVAFFGSNNAYGQEPLAELKNLVKEYGLELVATESFAPDATDMTAQLTSIARTSPDVTLVWSVSPSNAIIAQNAKDINFKPTLLHSSGAAARGYIDAAGKAAEGTFLIGTKITAAESLPSDDAQYKAIQGLRTAWTKAYSKEPDLYASIAWDAGLIMEQALTRGQIDPCNVQGARDGVRNSLESNIQDFAGANSQYSFSPEVHGPAGVKGLSAITVKNGKFEIVSNK
ncbi:ABC transporter substrate-binding protein [Specibacter sp. RAF43]|uniref:ABC transporter substrate-binding protein n=1 Tax=Specibacter sp. RAF43 TaxID=3233057 RepID=UPI003F96B8FE